MANLEALTTALNACFKQRSCTQWLERLEAAGVPAGPVLDVKQMHDDPQVRARDMVVDVPHRRLGKVKTIGAAVKLSATPGAVLRGAPLLGQHTREVLREYGYSEPRIQDLIKDGVIIAS